MQLPSFDGLSHRVTSTSVHRSTRSQTSIQPRHLNRFLKRARIMNAMSDLLPRRRGLAVVGVAAALLLVAACARAITRASASVKPASSAVGQAQPGTGLDGIGGVPTVAQSLSVPISECVVRRDTTHPVFHGCIDWHSAVHGNYALRVISRVTGDTKYLDIAQSVISPDGLSSELS